VDSSTVSFAQNASATTGSLLINSGNFNFLSDGATAAKLMTQNLTITNTNISVSVSNGELARLRAGQALTIPLMNYTSLNGAFGNPVLVYREDQVGCSEVDVQITTTRSQLVALVKLKDTCGDLVGQPDSASISTASIFGVLLLFVILF
jgi:hypothetical protein